MGSRGSVLLVDDRPELVEHIALHLGREGYAVTTVTDGPAAIEEASTSDFDTILLDVHMPGMSGIEVCHRLRDSGNEVPVIFLTADDSESCEIDGLDAGGDEYLVKPVSARAVERRIAAKLRNRTRINDLRAALEDWKSKASTDPLTGAKTRLYLKNLPSTVDGGGVIMVDVDHFKRFNDTFGHGAGDDCLRNVAAALLSLGHTVVRMGGEEFLLFVEDGDPGEVAASLVSLVRDTVRDPDRNPVAVSAGAVIADRTCELADAISAADKLLYESKSGGRNRFMFGRMSEEINPDSGERRRFRDRPA